MHANSTYHLIGEMQMNSSDFYERGYAIDAGAHLSPCQEWTERIFTHLDVLSKTASNGGTTATIVQRGWIRMLLQYYPQSRDVGCTLDASCTARRLVRYSAITTETNDGFSPARQSSQLLTWKNLGVGSRHLWKLAGDRGSCSTH